MKILFIELQSVQNLLLIKKVHMVEIVISYHVINNVFDCLNLSQRLINLNLNLLSFLLFSLSY